MKATNLAGEIVPEADRRGSSRRTLEDEALTFVKGNPDAISCVVCDISDSGARIKLCSGDFVPMRFKLCVPDKHILADCDQVWRKNDEVGLKFRSVAYIG